jgi:ATP-dependent helicase HepA
MNFSIGQRWLSHAEPQLGLGVVVSVEGRRITISFPAVSEERIYALNNSPLTRIVYNCGELVRLEDGREFTINDVNEMNGIMIYTGVDAQGNELTFSELQLSAHIQLTGPLQRLLTSPADNNSLFELRYETLQHLECMQESPVAGLIGARTNLLPHQIYIAAQVAKRYAPRVLLADEVGLGKTIEAGLILHHQLHSGLAKRILIVLPSSLQHQWLVEMLRRFNLRFSLFDEARFNALAFSEPGNPFESEQIILCSIDWLTNSEAAYRCAIAAPWDLLIVDEAHHLQWSPEKASDEYRCVEQLANLSAGLILLTATPEQAGVESHFARLRLIDPSRFYDIEAFKAEVANYQSLNQLVQKLQQEDAIDASLIDDFARFVDDQSIRAVKDKSELIQRLLDHYGTGRAVFRNTRAAVGGFPERHIHPVALPLPEIYSGLSSSLYPEYDYGENDWLTSDPRVEWLEQLLKEIRPAKALIICANATTALSLESHLQLRVGIRSAAFHEGMTLLERDRAAAWFADSESGARVLVCSEIGSEGRNFQFAQHLVLFDLPLNPDLLEQRIGRLDRIGQGPRIDIHIPYLEHTAQQVLFRWYHEGVDVFRRSFSAGYAIFEMFSERLNKYLQDCDATIDSFISDTKEHVNQTRIALSKGRDALLELNSCNVEQAEHFIDAIVESERSEELQKYMERLWDNFGVDHEFHSERAVVVRPSEQMLVSHFPELNEEGFTATFDRQTALQRDDMEFLTWEHPIVSGAMEMVLGAEYGNAAIASISIKGLPPGTLLLEAIYSVHCAAPKHLQVQRFLSNKPLRFVLDRNGKDLGKILPHEKLNKQCKSVPRTSHPAIIAQVRSEIIAMYDFAEKLAQEELPALIINAEQKLTKTLTLEIERLENLRRVNPMIREEEINFFTHQLEHGKTAISQANIQLQGLRLIIST